MTQLDPDQMLKKSIVVIKKLEMELEQLKQKSEEPIAIIGMSCRFPGGANTPEAFWDLLYRGGNGISDVPGNRFDADEYYDPDLTIPGKMISKKGGFLNVDVSLFDAEFFGISPREAEYMDPQQRLLLEVSYECLASAGLDPVDLKGSQTGVFVGICSHDYIDMIIESGDKTDINPYVGTGNAASTASGRISFVFDFQGPNFAIDTACSSSLVAIDQACESLRNGTSSLALAGGVNMILAPDLMIDFSKAGMLAPDGLCKTFDAQADGYVRGEGCGMIVLKRYSEAIRDGNRILAVIKSSCLNQDGASSGLTVPNGDAQEALINRVLANAKLKGADIDYVEAHGTGTSLGDPIEVRAIGSTYGVRDASHPLRLGSVKTNIGHLEGAAGVASVIKTVLALQYETIPKNLHFNRLNPHIELNFPAEVVVRNQEWKRGDKPRRAAVSSFGFSGTNAHLILEEAPFEATVASQQAKKTHHQFQRKRFWAEEAIPGGGKMLKSVHPLLGEMHQNPNQTISFYGEFKLSALPYLKDYQIFDYNIYPAAGYLEMMLAAGRHGLGSGMIELKNLRIESALNLSACKKIDTHILMNLMDASSEATIYTKASSSSWNTHSKGTISVKNSEELNSVDIGALKSRFTSELSKEEFYTKLYSSGIKDGPLFQTLNHIYVADQEVLGDLTFSVSAKGYLAHPVLLESALQLANENLQELYLPVGCDSFKLYASLEDHIFAHWQLTKVSDFERLGNLQIISPSGKLLVSIEGMHYRQTTLPAIKKMLSYQLSVDEWMYEWVWQEHKSEQIDLPVPFGHWLIVGEEDLSKQLIQLIESNGGSCSAFFRAELPKSKEEFLGLLKKENPSGVLHLAISKQEGELTTDVIRAAQVAGTQSFLQLTQALSLHNPKVPLLLISDDTLENSPLTGLFKTATIEHPEIPLRHIQLEGDWIPEMLLNSIFTKEEEEIFALKKDRIYVPRLVRQSEKNMLATEVQIRPDATYLISGGLGGLGQAVAKFLVQKGARHLVLIGRRKSEEILQIDDVVLTYESVDISDEQAVEDLMNRLSQSPYPLKGIFHLAGVTDRALLIDQDWLRYEKVYAPKVYGSFYLHQYSKDLDLFVMFSSIASSLGIQGQSNYSAANAFMDALCCYRKEKRMPALSISWGPWSDVGMAKGHDENLAKGGLLAIKPQDCLRALEEALKSSKGHLTIANINWRIFLKQNITVPSWLKIFSEQGDSNETLSILLEVIPAGERLNFIKRYVCDNVKEILKIAPNEALDEKKGFADLGFDSLMALELKNRLQSAIGKQAILPTTALFDFSTIEKLSEYIAQLLKVENIQVRKRSQAIVSAQPHEPVAIIGMSCRFPGGANNPDAFWELLHHGKDGIVEVPADRWDADNFYDPDREAPGKMITKRGGFLDIDVSLFDAEFFGISPREAEYMDPQQRLLLELTYEAIESAGMEPSSLQGTQTGVFIGISSHEYSDLLVQLVGENSLNPYIGIGNASSTAAGRISYVFDFQGPNFAIDTACSSSLVAIDQACVSLRTGAASLALAGGVNLLLSPYTSIATSKAGMLSPDGMCKTFDARADGYVRGEGCGMIVLKRYSDAIKDGDPILAVIKSSGINQDGASSGLTVPNGEAQEALINTVLTRAKLKGSDIDYLEAHGTGTSLGDPIEVRAIASTYGIRDPADPLHLGSVKTNIGHLEAAAGVAGVIKTILALQHETIPPNLHFHDLNPHIEANFPVEIVVKNQEWKREERTRRAAVSSFGFSGTNAHLILEEAPSQAALAAVSKIPHRHQFQRKRFWAELAIPGGTLRNDSVHPLLGQMLTTPGDIIIYSGSLQLGHLSYLKDHQVYDLIIFPGAGYLEMMIAASKHGLGTGLIELANVSIESILNVLAGKKIDTQVVMSPVDSGYEVEIYSRTITGSWNNHAKGTVSLKNNEELNSVDIEALKSRFSSTLSKDEFYSRVNTSAIHYGPLFQTLDKVYVGNQEAFGELTCSPSTKGYFVHPTLLDGCLQLIAVSLLNESAKDVYLPVGCDSFKLYAPLENNIFAHWRETEISEFGRSGDLQLLSPNGNLLALIKGMHYRKTTAHAFKQMLSHELSVDDWMYEWIWQEHICEDVDLPVAWGHWLLVGNNSDTKKITRLIESKGGSCRSIDLSELPKTKEELVALLDKENPIGILHFASSVHEDKLTAKTISHAQIFGSKTFLHLIQALIQHNSKIPLFLINDASLVNSPLNGLFKTVFLEHPEIEMKHISLCKDWDPEMLLKALFAKDGEAIFMLKEGMMYVPRLLSQIDAKAKRHELVRPVNDQFRLHSKEQGLLENLTLAPLELKDALAPNEVEIDVRAAGLNFRDVLIAVDALGFLKNPGPLGGEGAGIVTRVGESVDKFHVGDAVFGLMGDSFARKAYTHQDTITLKPSNLTFDEAAALPTVFLTAHYAFTRSTQLKSTDTVLIHAGAGGVGQAAIQLAKRAGVKIISTAGDEKKKAFLRKQGIEHIFDSRSLSFGEDIKKITDGYGVDVVLNSLSGEGFIETSLQVCKQGARFLEIGKRNIWTKMQMEKHRPDIDYHVIALDDLACTQPEIIREMLDELIPLFEEGKLSSIPITKYPIERSIQAFEYMKSAKHIGKVVITLPPQLQGVDKIQPNATYLITGGLGGLGQALTKFLAQKGARHIVLTGRRKSEESFPTNSDFPEVEITYESIDISNEQSVEDLIKRLTVSAYPLKGVFHLAAILDDALVIEQDWSRFEAVFAPKVYGSYYLHKYAKDLDFFVLFSSVASVWGSPGQSNYAAANAFMDALCEYRKENGLAGLSLSWGPWSEIGLAKDLVSRHASKGIIAINPSDGMRAFEIALSTDSAHTTIINVNRKTIAKQMVNIPSWLKAFEEQKASKGQLIEQLEAIDTGERLIFIKKYVGDTLKEVLGISTSRSIDEKKGFASMGLDSMLAVELKNRLQSGIGKKTVLATTAIFDHSTVEKLSEYIAQLLKVENIQVRKHSQAMISIQSDEPIAIIGMSCRFPGGSNNPEAFWKLLQRGGDGICEVPASRFDADSYFDSDPETPGKMITKKGGFLDIDVSLFDAEFFGISPREAEYMDPQQRLLLELSYEAIESADIDPLSLQGTQTGVFIGICSHDYMNLLNESGDKTLINPFMGTGNAASTATGRISFVFDFQGPNMAIDTACSSSLVAIDQACQSLRNGTSSLVLVGGVNLILTPDLMIDFSKAGMLSPDGRCKTFDASADGFVRGEGGGIIVLKRYSEATRDGNHILAIIKSSGVNQDGASSGLTVPNGEAQEALISQILTKAKLKGSDIDYVEAHGTGTSLGDPIEFRAIGATYGIRDAAYPLRLGSVKTNIGHLEGAAGIAGVIKTVLALQHEMIPTNLHFHHLNPHIELTFPADILTKNQEWKRGEKTRRAAVSSFGFSGTNAHLIIEEAPLQAAVATVPKIQNRHQFQRKRFWAIQALSGDPRKFNQVHPLLGLMNQNPNDTISFNGELQLGHLPYLKEHQVYDYIIYPGAGYLEMMLGAARNGLGDGIIELANVSIESVLNLPVGKKIDTQVLMTPAGSGYEVEIYTRTDRGSWNTHAKGIVSVNNSLQKHSFVNIEVLKSRLTAKITKDEFYSRMNSSGVKYGASFQTIDQIHVGDQEVLGELTLSVPRRGYLAHPTLLDGCLQLLAVSLSNENANHVFLPVGCDSLKLYATLEDRIFAYWQETARTDLGRSGNLQLFSANGQLLAAIQGVNYRKTTEQAVKRILASELSMDDWMYEWSWEEYACKKAESLEPVGPWLILGDVGSGLKLLEVIKSKDGTCKSILESDLPQIKEEFVALLNKENPCGILHFAGSAHDDKSTSDLIRTAQLNGSKIFLYLTQALVQLNRSIPLVLINHCDLANSPLNGFFKTVRLEHPELEMKHVVLGTDWVPEKLLDVIYAKDDESIFQIKGSKVFVLRLLKQKESKIKRHELIRPYDDQFRLQSKEKGLLQNLFLAPMDTKEVLAPYEIEVDIHATGLNFRDVLDALGLYPGDAGHLGGDGCGVITRVGRSVIDFRPGEEVLGLMSGCLASKAYTHQDIVTLKPANLSFETAAALPTVFLTAYYAFTRSTQLKASDTVLVHAGAGGVGQAAIQLAKLAGAKIIATAGDEKKRAFLRIQGVEHVFDSRSLSFAEEIEKMTEGRGVDVVLNSLTGEGFIEASLSVCKPAARFIEISKRNIWTKEQMRTHRPDVDYHVIALDDTAQSQPQVIREMFNELMPLFGDNQLSPIPITTFSIEHAIQAFECMKSAKHVGKIVIKLPPQQQIENRIRSDATYLITGGLGGIGKVLANFLVQKGARHIVLTGRKKSEENLRQDEELKEGVIIYESLDISNENAVEDLIKRLTGSVFPLKGIFHLAGVLDDATLMEQDWPRFESVFAPKVYGSFYLHKYSRDLDFFVLFSSVASILGSPGQSNYAAANAFMDALCKHREEEGLPALSISWGTFTEVGMAKDLVYRHAKGGIVGISPKEGMRALETALFQVQGHVSIANINWKTFLKQLIEVPSWLRSFSVQNGNNDGLIKHLEALPADERFNYAKAYVTGVVKEILGVSSLDSVDEKIGFADMGFDSLMAVELKNRLQASIGKSAVLPSSFVFDHPSIEKLTKKLGIILKIPSNEKEPHLEAQEKSKPEEDDDFIKKNIESMDIHNIMDFIKEVQSEDEK